MQLCNHWLGEAAITGMYYIQMPFRALSYYCQTHADLQKQIQTLTIENQRLHQLEHQAISFKKENEILRKLAKVVEESHSETLTVRVLGNPSDHLSSTLVIEKKSTLNLQKNQVVLSAEGVIGRIYKVGLACAWVLLITDSRSRIPARVASTGEEVILIGENTAELKVLHAAAVPLQAYYLPQKGDLLVTSGFGGVYPPGLPIAHISSFNEGVLKATILSKDYGEYVSVLKNVIPTENDPLS